MALNDNDRIALLTSTMALNLALIHETRKLNLLLDKHFPPLYTGDTAKQGRVTK